MKFGESQTQRAYAQWARFHPIACKGYAVPNGGARSKVTAAILKAEGVKPGVPDWHLPVARGACHSLYIEFKHGSNNLTPDQAQVAADLVAEGHAVIVAWDWETAAHWTLAYLRSELTPGLLCLKPPPRRSTPSTLAAASRR